jgi:hypothetical protein
MKQILGRSLAMGLAMGALLPVSADAQTLFSDLGSSGTYTPYATGGGRIVTGGGNPSYPYANVPAYAFSPATSGIVTEIDLGLSCVSGTNGITVTLWTAVPWSIYVGSSFGTIQPGIQLGSWTVTAIPSYTENSSTALTSIKGVSGIELTAGSQYFIQLAPADATSYVVWNGNSLSVNTTLWQCGASFPTIAACNQYISYASTESGALDVLGTAASVGAEIVQASVAGGAVLVNTSSGKITFCPGQVNGNNGAPRGICTAIGEISTAELSGNVQINAGNLAYDTVFVTNTKTGVFVQCGVLTNGSNGRPFGGCTTHQAP